MFVAPVRTSSSAAPASSSSDPPVIRPIDGVDGDYKTYRWHVRDATTMWMWPDPDDKRRPCTVRRIVHDARLGHVLEDKDDIQFVDDRDIVKPIPGKTTDIWITLYYLPEEEEPAVELPAATEPTTDIAVPTPTLRGGPAPPRKGRSSTAADPPVEH